MIKFDYFCTAKKFLLFNLVSRDLKIKYRRSFLGFFWTVFHPLMLSGVYYLVFKVVLKIEAEHYIPFILSGVISWSFFSTSILEGTDTLQGNAGLLTKVPVPTQIFPLVACLTNFFTLLLSIPILIGCSYFSGVHFRLNIALIPILYLMLFIIAHAFSVTLSIAYVYLRDLKHAMNLVMQLWFYATPVLYSIDMVPKQYQYFFFFNPVGSIFSAIQNIFTGKPVSLVFLSTALVWLITVFVVGVYVQSKWSKTVVEAL